MPYNNSINWGLGIPINVDYADTPNIDAFGRLRVSNPVGVFDTQLTYDLQPLLYEKIVTGAGASIAHDATNRQGLMTFASTPTGGTAYMQSYQFLRYQPGQSLIVLISFNFKGGVANCLKSAGYKSNLNGVQIELNGTAWQITLYSGTTLGNTTIAQASWNLDKMDGTGTSGITLDSTKTQILILDFQALYSGRVRVGFDIGGQYIYCHEFLNSNISLYPYIQTANLPVRVGMTCTATVNTTMTMVCASVMNEGGIDEIPHYSFSFGSTKTAANGVATYFGSIRPRATFNGITNRTIFRIVSIDILVTGNSSVYWQLCVGQALTTPTYTAINATYSAFEGDFTGTLSGTPAIIIESGYVAATNGSKSTISTSTPIAYPITLDAAGNPRDLGTLTLLVTGIGGASVMYASLTYSEER